MKSVTITIRKKYEPGEYNPFRPRKHKINYNCVDTSNLTQHCSFRLSEIIPTNIDLSKNRKTNNS